MASKLLDGQSGLSIRASGMLLSEVIRVLMTQIEMDYRMLLNIMCISLMQPIVIPIVMAWRISQRLSMASIGMAQPTSQTLLRMIPTSTD